MDKAQRLFEEGLAAHQQGRLEEAATLYRQALVDRPEHFDSLRLLGIVHGQLDQYDRAVELIERAIAIDPGAAVAHGNRGIALQALGRFDEAIARYDRAIALGPGDPSIHLNRGVALYELKRPAEALAAYDKAIALKPDYAKAFNNRGNALNDLKRYAEALASYDRAIALRPDDAGTFSNRGASLIGLERFEAALASYDKAIALNPDYTEAFSNRGTALRKLGRQADALASYDTAIELQPDYAEAHSNRGNVLAELRRFDDALVSHDRAVSFKPDHADAWSNRGNTLFGLKRYDEALSAYDKALAIKPDLVAAWLGRGDTLKKQQRHDEALQSLSKARDAAPDHEFIKGHLLHQRMLCCDWTDLDRQIVEITADLALGKRSARPFGWQGLSASDESLKRCAEIWNRDKYPRVTGMDQNRTYTAGRAGGRIRIGYVSGEFREQATSHLIVGMLEAHDKKRFEVVGFDNGSADGSAIRRRIDGALDEIVSIQRLDDAAAARAIRDARIDILVNLNGYFGDERTGVFAHRPAPIAVNYLGFPGTLGADYIDYILADTTVIPRDTHSNYTEKVVYLPNSYQANDDKRRIADRVFTRSDLGLPDSGFVFCCFNNAYKILPATFDVWMRLLRNVSGSVLWLLESNAAAARNLRREAEKRSIDSGRLVFAPFLPPDEHLARQRMADLFLDTLPYNAHTTASDALWAGLPVLTCIGTTFAGRVAASLLKAVGLPELIAQTEAEYETRALELATNPRTLSAVRHRLEHNRLTSPLFDTGLFTRHIEAAYVAMQDRRRAGLAPASIEVG
jgi:protein O-GlcNAc transferase